MRIRVGVTALLAVLVSVLLGTWFVSGWRGVRMRQSELRAAPVAAASGRADSLATTLRRDLDALLDRESRRPSVDYQDVASSPLAHTPEDKLVLGYFQIDAQQRTTTPTVNDQVPALSDAENLAANRAFRDQVARDVTPVLARERAAVTVEVSPLSWRTLGFAGQPALIAVRSVQTPDGRVLQGFVVDRATLTSRLAASAGELVAELHADTGAPGAAFAPGWTVSVSANPRAISRAATEARAVARHFLIRFLEMALCAAVGAALVVLAVVRRSGPRA